jgi:flagellar biosynthesis/type III secretory pathway protein FliH
MSGQKFKFDRVFSTDGQVTEPPPRARRSFKAEELEAARVESFKEGERSSLVKIEQQAAGSTAVLANGIQNVLNSTRAELDGIRDGSTRLAALIARRFVEHMIAHAPDLYLERCIEECLELVHREPEIVIDIPASAPPSLKDRLNKMAEEYRLDMAMRVIENQALSGVTCRLHWKGGGAEVSLEDTLNKIDQIIEDHISSLSAGAQVEPQAESQQAIA